MHAIPLKKRGNETELPPAQAPRMRWWPALIILVLASAVWAYIWLIQEDHRQAKNLRTALLAILTCGLLMLWMLLFSRIRWRRRLGILAIVVALFGVAAATLEIRGVTGDLVPVLAWRWQTAAALPEQQGQAEFPALEETSDSPQDYPQLYGPTRDALLSSPPLATDWDAQPPEQLWRQPIGAGWAGFSVSGHYAVTLEQRDEMEAVTCYHLTTGALLWKHVDAVRYESTIAGEGPRTAPTITTGRVFTLGATGLLNCLGLADGKLIWSKDIVADNESEIPQWGISCSPLVFDGMVIVCAGGKDGRSLVAYDEETGERIWSGGDQRAHYSSPLLANIAGSRQAIIFNSRAVAGHSVETGEVLWQTDWPRGGTHVTMPIVTPDGKVLISSGYGVGSALIQIKRDDSGTWSTSTVWKSKHLKSKFANMFVRGGFIYGLDDGILTCVDLTTGKRKWKRGRYGHGQMILVDRLLLVMSEKGAVVLLDPNPNEHRELARFSIFDGKTWNPPALAGNLLLVRTDSEAACFRLPIANSTAETRR